MASMTGAFVKSLDAVTATGEGTAASFGGHVRSTHAIQVSATGSPTGLVVKLQGSLNGTNWFTLATWDITAPLASGDMLFVTGKPVNQVRADCTTLSGGTSPTVSAWVSSAG